MKTLRALLVLFALASTQQLRAQGYPVIDLQSIFQLGTLNNVANSQLGALGNILQIGTRSLEQAQQINNVLGQPGGISSLLRNSSIYDLQGMLRQIPGMQNVDVNTLFPPSVMGAFLGKTLGQWKEMISNPSTLFAQELKRAALGGLVFNGTVRPEEASFMDYITRSGSKDLSNSRLYVATTFSRLLTARVLEMQKQQADQQAAYAAQKQRLDEAGQGNLTILDRQKLTNDQKSLELEMQLNAVQAQALSNTDQAVKLDAQTQIMEQQLMREEMDRATRPR